MELVAFEYSEFDGDPRSWSIAPTKFGHVNLIVGRNAVGKTRALNVLNGLALILTAKRGKLPETGNNKITFESSVGTFVYEVSFSKRGVSSERFTTPDGVMLRRDMSGKTRMRFVGESKPFITVQVPNDQIAAFSRRDPRQHPYLETLYEWAESVRHVEFGKDLGKQTLIVLKGSATGADEEPILGTAPPANQAAALYAHAFKQFGDKFRRAVLSDMLDFGYSCTAVGVQSMKREEFRGPPVTPMYLYVKERDLKCQTRQIEMSAGMFRALALSINLNYVVLAGGRACFLIDDIGEGLDFDRSTLVVKNLISKAEKSAIQLIMTTNDRFIMNSAPLDYWTVLDRRKNQVRTVNKHNAPKIFDAFRYSGLNNFDFFAYEMFRSKSAKTVGKKSRKKTSAK